MNNKVYKFGYEDTDKKIEIELYGLVFEIKNLDNNNIESLKNLDKENENNVEKTLENILGEGSIEKINNKRKSDGYNELDLNIELNILGCIFEAYANATVDNITNKVQETAKNINNKVNDFNVNNFNREEKREYRRNYNRRNRRRY